MKPFGKLLSLFACLAMLMLQGVGAHLHVDVAGHEDEPHHDVHLEGSLSGDHLSTHHDAHIDVSFLDTAPVSLGIDFALLPPVHNVEPLNLAEETRWSSPPSTAPPRCIRCYLPPLRAPPASA
jgi:hypothetical protein